MRLIANPLVLRRFLCFLSTEAPFSPPEYPPSSVLRASPTLQTARPVSRELPVGPFCDYRWGLPVLRLIPLHPHAVATTLTVPMETCSLVHSHRLRPSPNLVCQVAFTTLYTRDFSSLVASSAAPIATGCSEPVPGLDFHPLWISTFSRCTEKSGVARFGYRMLRYGIKYFDRGHNSTSFNNAPEKSDVSSSELPTSASHSSKPRLRPPKKGRAN